MRRLFACLAFLMLCAAGTAAEYHGFQIDDRARQLAPDALASLTAQLDIVEAVGLPPAVLQVMKETPLVVDPELRGQPGIFAVRRDLGAVYVRPIRVRGQQADPAARTAARLSLPRAAHGQAGDRAGLPASQSGE